MDISGDKLYLIHISLILAIRELEILKGLSLESDQIEIKQEILELDDIRKVVRRAICINNRRG